MTEQGSFAGTLGRIVGVALRSFFGTLFFFLFAGIVLAGISFAVLRDEPLDGFIAAVVALIESATSGFFLGGKRAVAMSIAHGVRTLQLGRKALGLIFSKLLGVSEEDAFGRRGGATAQALERVPLAQAETRLRSAVENAIAADATSGWFRRKIQSVLLRMVEKTTLARFREEGTREGGIDLVKAQTELGSVIDDAVVNKVRGGLNLWTMVVLLGLPLIVAVQTWIVVLRLRSHG